MSSFNKVFLAVSVLQTHMMHWFQAGVALPLEKKGIEVFDVFLWSPLKGGCCSKSSEVSLAAVAAAAMAVVKRVYTMVEMAWGQRKGCRYVLSVSFKNAAKDLGEDCAGLMFEQCYWFSFNEATNLRKSQHASIKMCVCLLLTAFCKIE